MNPRVPFRLQRRNAAHLLWLVQQLPGKFPPLLATVLQGFQFLLGRCDILNVLLEDAVAVSLRLGCVLACAPCLLLLLDQLLAAHVQPRVGRMDCANQASTDPTAQAL